MGAFVKDHHVAGMLDNLNMRFGHKDGVREMAGLHKEFGLFKPGHDLSKSFAALNTGPVHDWRERRGWHKYLDWLHKAPSDRAGVSGHDRITRTLDAHLTSRSPSPVHFTSHPISHNKGVTVKPNDR